MATTEKPPVEVEVPKCPTCGKVLLSCKCPETQLEK
jgi:hypothetical protein